MRRGSERGDPRLLCRAEHRDRVLDARRTVVDPRQHVRMKVDEAGHAPIVPTWRRLATAGHSSRPTSGWIWTFVVIFSDFGVTKDQF